MLGDGPAHRRLDLGLSRELVALGDPRGRLLEDIGHRHLLALGLCRVHRRQQIAEELRHRDRFGGLDLGLPARPLRLAAEADLADQTDHHQGDQDAGDHHPGAVASDKEPRAVAQRPRACAHRLTFEVAFDVGSELLGRGIARFGIGSQRLETDGVEIA